MTTRWPCLVVTVLCGLLTVATSAFAASDGVWVLLSPPLFHNGPVASDFDHVKWFYLKPDKDGTVHTDQYYADGDFETLSACHNARSAKGLEYRKRLHEVGLQEFEHTPTAKELAEMKKNVQPNKATPQEKSFAAANYERYQIALCVWRAK